LLNIFESFLAEVSF